MWKLLQRHMEPWTGAPGIIEIGKRLMSAEDQEFMGNPPKNKSCQHAGNGEIKEQGSRRIRRRNSPTDRQPRNQLAVSTVPGTEEEDRRVTSQQPCPPGA